MKVLTIGATGFIGSHVVRLLNEQGHEVAVLHRGETEAELPENVRHIHCARSALSRIASRLRRFAPEVVLDLIAYTEKEAQELVQVVRGLARRLVVLSSADVYRNYDGLRGRSAAPPDPSPLSEGSPLRETRFPYRGHDLPFPRADDYEKILVEQVVLGAPDLPATVLRLPAVYGAGDARRRLRPYLRRMDDRRPALLLAEEQAGWRWTRGYVENVAAAISLAVTHDRAAEGVYNVGEERASTEREWIEEIGAAAGWEGQVVTIPEQRLPEHLRQRFDFRYDLATDTGRIRRELGFEEPLGRREGLRETIRWERAQRAHRDRSDRPDYAAEDAALAAARGAV